MRMILAITMALALASPASAQEETLIDGDIEYGWFFAPIAKLSVLDGDLAFLGGARGGLIINHNLNIGGGIFSLDSKNISRQVTGPDEIKRMTLTYGGLMGEYDFNPLRLTHVSVVMLLGYGEANYEFKGPDYQYIDDALADGLFVFEPEIDFTVNLTTFAHVGAGAGYRFVSGVERHGLSNGDIAGPSISAIVRFGNF